VTIPKGTALPASPVTPGGMTAIDCKIIYYSEAAGYLVGQIFSGTFRSEQQREPLQDLNMRVRLHSVGL
jgi:hypothetical protein